MTAQAFVQGRRYCPSCRIVRTVVAAPDAVIRCPHCDTLTEPACGDEADLPPREGAERIREFWPGYLP